MKLDETGRHYANYVFRISFFVICDELNRHFLAAAVLLSSLLLNTQIHVYWVFKRWFTKLWWEWSFYHVPYLLPGFAWIPFWSCALRIVWWLAVRKVWMSAPTVKWWSVVQQTVFDPITTLFSRPLAGWMASVVYLVYVFVCYRTAIKVCDEGTCSLVSPWPELNNEPGVYPLSLSAFKLFQSHQLSNNYFRVYNSSIFQHFLVHSHM